MTKKFGVAELEKRLEPAPVTYQATDEDLPEIFFKTVEQIAEAEWEELWHRQT